MDAALARTLWHHVETLNAVTYFCQECRDAPANLGLTGFWSGYFACRAAPMGPVPPGVVEATFFNFHPARVRKALPAAWAVAPPDELVTVRSAAAARALRRLLPDGLAEAVAAEAVPALRAVVEGATPAGRPLFAANRDVPLPDDPVEALWQLATTFREHRGDGHVALLTATGLDGCEVHVLFAADEGVAPEVYQRSRGWSDDDWRAAVDRLVQQDLVTPAGTATTAGRALRAQVEERTDELSADALADLGTQGVQQLLRVLRPATGLLASSGELLYPNPMGLPSVEPGT
jgi:hypothetical protein